MHDFDKLVSYFIETDSLIFTDNPYKLRLTANVELEHGLHYNDPWIILTKDRRVWFTLGKDISEKLTKLEMEARKKKKKLTASKEADQLLNQIMNDLSAPKTVVLKKRKSMWQWINFKLNGEIQHGDYY